MMYKKGNILCLVAILFIVLFPCNHIGAQEIQMSAPDEVLPGEVFQVRYDIHSARPLEEIPRLTDSKDFDTVRNPKVRQTSPSPFGRRNYYTLSITCHLKAKKSGKWLLPMVEVTVDGETTNSPQKEIHVRELPEVNDAQFFVEVDQTKSRVKVGDTLTITYKLYSTKEIAGITRFDSPNLSGFNIQDMTPRRLHYTEETIDGISYKVYIIRQLLLQATRTGTKELPETDIEVQYNHPTGRKGRDRWGRAYEEQIRSSKKSVIAPVTIRVHDMISI